MEDTADLGSVAYSMRVQVPPGAAFMNSLKYNYLLIFFVFSLHINLGYSQVVRRRFLVPSYEGSIPSTPI